MSVELCLTSLDLVIRLELFLFIISCEWHMQDRQENVRSGRADDIYFFSLVDNHGNKVQLHL
jgi:hypothetical protein